MEGSISPVIIFLISGKRKSGKDYVSELLQKRIGADRAVLLHTAAPIKLHWALEFNLSYDDMLSSSSYKEKYREEMVEWGMQMRAKDYGFFCRAAIDMTKATSKPVWIVADVRHKTDIKWFSENYPGRVKTARVIASTETRISRGWSFKEGVDDVPSECEMDDYTDWNLIINNNTGEDSNLETQINILQNMYYSKFKPKADDVNTLVH